MYAVGRLGSYISRGVYIVSGPFHPFGGAVDIIVVEQQDGSFKSSPWYVRFGKFQGVLKAKEKVVSISVDGVPADFHMYLDSKGEAYFLSEVDVKGGGDSVLSPSSSGEETDEQSGGFDKRPVKSKSCNFDTDGSNLVSQIDISNVKILKKTSSRRSRIMGLVFGRKSMIEDTCREEEDVSYVVRSGSLERAEIAAELLEVNWSTNFASSRYKKAITSHDSPPERLDFEEDKAVDSLLNNDMVNILNSPQSDEEISIHGNGIANNPQDGLPKLEISDDCVEMPSTNHIIGTSSLGESLQENYELNLQKVREVYEFHVSDSGHDENSKSFICEATTPNPDSAVPDAGPISKMDEKQVLNEENGIDRLEAFSYSDMVGVGDSGGETTETFCVSCCGGVEVCIHAKMHHEIAEMISEAKSVQDTSLLVAKEPLEFPNILVDGNSVTLLSDAQIPGSEGPCSNSSGNSFAAEKYAQMVIVEEINSVKDVESCSIYTLSGLDNSISEVQDGEKPRENPVADLQEFRNDSLSIGPITVSPSEEELLFGDIDDFNQGNIKCLESSPSNQFDNEYHPPANSKYRESVIESVIQSLNPNDLIQENTLNTVEDFREKSVVVSTCISIPCDKGASKKFRRMAESLPNMWSHTHGVVVDDLHHPLGHSLDSNSEPLMLTPLREDFSLLVKSDVNNEEQETGEDVQLLEELKNGPANTVVGNQHQGIDATSGSWRVWPFRFKNSRSMKATQPDLYPTRSSDDKITLEGSSGMDGETDVLKTKVKRKKVRVLTPTTEQLASLNLKEGKNIVTFTFSTSMLGQQQVDARIYLWKWDTRVVISDVDGTITKSDVLGQFMPLVGMDWSHTGVAHLFSAIKENGYHLLFLSARAISQAYNTRRFLFNLKQDGKALPDGPVVISPDGLFPSLYREVIRRAPHEFKIACLEDIKALFPSDRNPFYAGFGNRDTDEFSYLKVGIPKGKIFIINPKGEVVVNRRVDSKSYTSLHALVHDMFPPTSSSEQEYFNSWNYWKLPPPAIDF